MKKYFFPLLICAIFIFIAALFLTPSFTQKCTEQLLMCVEETSSLNVMLRLWANLKCVFYNVVCVLGGLFV